MRYTLPTLLLFLSVSLFAQQGLPNSCDTPPAAQVVLESNGVHARLTTGGDLWWDGDDGSYLVSADPDSLFSQPVSTMFAGGLWMAGMDPGGGIKMAAQQYGRGGGSFDYGPGPLTADGMTDSLCINWDRFFGVTREDIDQFQLLPDGGFGPDDVPVSILGWPGRGNSFFAGVHDFELPDSDLELAPFWDENQDGLYNPLDGDYPAFCGDQAYWCVFNDAVLHRQSGASNHVQAEVHLLAYSYDTEADDDLFRTTFYDYSIYNRAQEDALNFHAGLWLDFDIGCFTDDLVGSIPEHNLVYGYNETAQDASPCFGDIASFENEVPVQIMQVVNTSAEGERKLYSAASYMDFPLGQIGAGLSPPGSADEYYNYLRGFWRDGQPIVRNRLGYHPEGDTTLYTFDGGQTPDGNPWKACSNNIGFVTMNPIASTGPYNLQPGQRAEFTIAMTTVFGVSYPDECPDLSPVIAAAEAVQLAYNNSCQRSDLTSTEERPVAPGLLGLTVFPNPTGGEITFRLPAGRNIARIEVLDVTGRVLAITAGTGNQQSLDLAGGGLSAGVYFYRLRTGAGLVTTGRVVLQ